MDIEAAKTKLFQHLRQEISDKKVLDAMERIPRELFVPAASQHVAYTDIPLPIAEGQTISQPFIVALMTQALGLEGTEKVLEIGTGSGYQTAILAELARWVVSVERFETLVEGAKRILDTLGYKNVEIHLTKQTIGWSEGAPYEAIIVTAGAPCVPQELLDQLAVGGRLVIPVGSRYEQELVKVIKKSDGIVTHNLGGCRFVPLIGEGAWSED